MTLKIDSAGRIVLPKPLRRRPGLDAGAEIELTESAGGALLKPAERRPSLVREGHFLVHQGTMPAEFDLARAIDEDRDARSYHVLGSR
jgi:AbrB family looped-hinge helix DNA binding protein